MKAFTSLLTPEQARAAFARVFPPRPLGTERIPLLRAYGRILAQDVRAGADLPAFDRSTVDGYAVRAAETAEASKGAPSVLRVVREIHMGGAAGPALQPGETARIPTGGAVPPGADAVVMQEHTVRKDGTVAVERPVAPGENIVRRGEDLRAGDVVLRAGRRLRPEDIGLLAGLNHPEVEIYLRPRVGLIVTGDELVPPGREVTAGQIYDMNTYTLTGLIEAAGGDARPYGIVGDSLQLVVDLARTAHRETDLLILVGGSSVGERDVVTDAVAALGEPGIVVHGVAIRPGRPTILAAAGGKPVFGVPGNVVSAMVVFLQFVRPVLEAMAGLREERRFGRAVRARLARPVAARDREEHLRVALAEREGRLWAIPVPGGSAIMTSMVRSDGIVTVPVGVALPEGAEVEVTLLAP